ncbi:MAG TPA: DUF1045 domain-containing protein [Comamonas sp.]
MSTMNELAKAHRIAIYFAPAMETELWQKGSQWLCRCAATSTAMPQPVVPPFTAKEFQQLTQEPRRYGLHATLKAPFRLAEGVCVDNLLDAIGKICATHRKIALSPLRVSRLGNFLSLRPSEDQAEVSALASDCVKSLQPFAAPLTKEEWLKRRRANLSAEQELLVQQWGYPWVFEHFRFHISLTGPLKALAQAQLLALQSEAERYFHHLAPCVLDRIAVFAEFAPGADFQLITQMELAV